MGPAGSRPTERAAVLSRVYGPNGLLLLTMLWRGSFDHLAPAELMERARSQREERESSAPTDKGHSPFSLTGAYLIGAYHPRPGVLEGKYYPDGGFLFDLHTMWQAGHDVVTLHSPYPFVYPAPAALVMASRS